MRTRLEPSSLESTLIQRYIHSLVHVDVDMCRSELRFTRVHLRLKNFRNFSSEKEQLAVNGSSKPTGSDLLSLCLSGSH